MTAQEYLEQDKKKLKSLRLNLIITLLGGWFGAHKLYQKKYLMFMLYLGTYGIYLLGYAYDLYKAIKEYLLFKKIYEFYTGPTFEQLVTDLRNHTLECNQLNEHIEELKKSYSSTQSLNRGYATMEDYSRYDYKRNEWEQLSNNSLTINCSASICKNAQAQPFKYLCKYFDIDINEKSLENFSQIFNDFSAAEEGKILLLNKRKIILNSIDNFVPDFIKNNDYNRFINRLGFDDVDISDLYFPKYKFLYVSPGGNSSMACEIKLDLENLNNFIHFLSEKIQQQKSTQFQRSLMTPKLREYIKRRDNYTCQKCGLSTYMEPNLLLEIDHIQPISQGGITTEDNLQTLCWRCNRKKGAKILF